MRGLQCVNGHEGTAVAPMTKEEATEIARKAVDDLKSDRPLILWEEKTQAKDFGWVFFVTTQRYIEWSS